MKIATVKCQELTEAIQKALATPTTSAKMESSILEMRRGAEEVKPVMSEGVRSEGVKEVTEEEEEEVVCLVSV